MKNLMNLLIFSLFNYIECKDIFLFVYQKKFYFVNNFCFFCKFLGQASKVCYEGLGCFSSDYPFYDPIIRPVHTLPESPQKINTKFLLYSYAKQMLPKEVDPKKWSTTKYSTLSHRSLKLKVIIHGLVKDIRRTDKWIKQLVGQYLNKSELQNVIVVDWTDGALDYTQAVANARVVGAQVTQLIITLRKEVSTSLSLIHLIGEGVGAHAAGYAGERLEGWVGLRVYPRHSLLRRSAERG